MNVPLFGANRTLPSPLPNHPALPYANIKTSIKSRFTNADEGSHGILKLVFLRAYTQLWTDSIILPWLDTNDPDHALNHHYLTKHHR